MTLLSNGLAAARRGGAAASSFASLPASSYGRTAAYRRIATTALSRQRLPRIQQSSTISPLPSSTSALLESRLTPHDILSRTVTAYSAHFSTRSPLYQQAQKKEEEDLKPPPAAEETPPQQEGEQKKPEEEPKKEGEESSSENESSEKKEDKKGDAPPPPPHGDKTPWQVFMETLKTEFKANKEWNESTKQLASGYQEFTQNPTLQKAQSAYKQASSAATSTTTEALKKTGHVVGKGAAWTWETPVVKGVRKSVNAAGRGVEKATRPLRETDAYKDVKKVIDDGSSSRYGGWVEKEERRKLREAREAEEIKKYGGKRPVENMEEDPEAGTNVTLHKDAAWKESWREFRDNSKLMQSIFAMKSHYNESENPLISTARSVSDRIAGFFAENETAMVIKKFREIDPNFQLEPFLQEMREYILPEVLDAYVRGDLETLKLWLSAAQYQVYAALMQQYTVAGLKSDGRILDIRNVDILSARILEPGEVPVFVLTCRTQEVHVYRNLKSGELAAGMDDKVQQVTYAIAVTRTAEEVASKETMGWRLIELQKSARDYI